MKKIFKFTSVFINGAWSTPQKTQSNYAEDTAPPMHRWLDFGVGRAVYLAYEGETPSPPSPNGVGVLKASPTPEQKKRIAEKKPCGCGGKPQKAAETKDKTKTASKFTKRPDDGCWDCAEKHLGTAYALYSKEAGYKELNRWHYIGELNNAVNHLWGMNQGYAEKIRILRHDIQLGMHVSEERWQELAKEFYSIRNIELTAPEKIYVFSNVKHEAPQKITASNQDMLVFLNKAVNADLYREHANKCVFHRSNKPEYGALRTDMPNFFVFDDVPKDVIRKIKTEYDWNYDIEEGKIKSCTTGYMTVLYLENKYPDAEIVLVNFGYEVKKSTYRCPWHNWTFEAEQLSRFQHIII